VIETRLIQVLCLIVLCVILFAGLAPFHAPINDVNWLKGENGLQFGPYGSVLSSSPLPASGSACSLEIWLAPHDVDDANTILAFDSTADPLNPFSLEQHNRNLVITHLVVNPQGKARKPSLKVPGIFQKGTRVFVTITAGKQNTSIYVNGVLAKASSTFGLSSADWTGKLVMADSTFHDNWSGQVLGLAMYHQDLTPTQVAQHYESWTQNQRPAIAGDEAPAALYLFNERGGNIVHDQAHRAPDLLIPGRYSVLHQQYLQSALRDYLFGWPGWGYWQDVIINIAGFMPLGFCFLSYFSSVRKVQHPVAAVIFLGFSLSFAIETTQWFLPTRDSDTTDVMTNTLGTVLGVLVWRWPFAQGLYIRSRDYVVSAAGNLLPGSAGRSSRDEQAEQVEFSA
jgi:hypothetical protein